MIGINCAMVVPETRINIFFIKSDSFNVENMLSILFNYLGCIIWSGIT